jgi:hypothetical protein
MSIPTPPLNLSIKRYHPRQTPVRGLQTIFNFGSGGGGDNKRMLNGMVSFYANTGMKKRL